MTAVTGETESRPDAAEAIADHLSPYGICGPAYRGRGGDQTQHS